MLAGRDSASPCKRSGDGCSPPRSLSVAARRLRLAGSGSGTRSRSRVARTTPMRAGGEPADDHVVHARGVQRRDDLSGSESNVSAHADDRQRTAARRGWPRSSVAVASRRLISRYSSIPARSFHVLAFAPAACAPLSSGRLIAGSSRIVTTSDATLARAAGCRRGLSLPASEIATYALGEADPSVV